MLLMCKQARTPVCIKIDHSHYCHPAEAWKSLTDKVQEARSNARLKELSFEGDFENIPQQKKKNKTFFGISLEYCLLVVGVNGLRMLGIVHEAVVFLLEQLYGSRQCHNYRFRFHKPDEPNEPSINPHGSARAEINHRFEKKNPHKYTAIKLEECAPRLCNHSKHPRRSHACLCF